MTLLPERLVAIDDDGKPRNQETWFEVVKPEGRSERDWDRIIAENADALTFALRAAGLIAEDSVLRTLSKPTRQIDSVDLLFAEIAEQASDDDSKPEGWGALRRLVLLEDKLVTNPEAKREVLAQIVEYADFAQRNWTVDYLKKRLPERSAWLAANGAQLEVMLREGDFLLVIAGNDIRDDVLALARRFSMGHNPLSLCELCLVSMALYKRGSDELLVPHVVSAVERYQRQLTIRVTVHDDAGEPLKVTAERDVEADRQAQSSAYRQGRWDEASFFKELQRQCPESVGFARHLVEFAKTQARECSRRLQWGRGNLKGTMVFKWIRPDRSVCSIFGLNTDGLLGIFYGDMKDKMRPDAYERALAGMQALPGMKDVADLAARGATMGFNQLTVSYPLTKLFGSAKDVDRFLETAISMRSDIEQGR